MKENEYITITRESYNMMNDLLIERANHIVDLRKKVESLQKQLNEANKVIKKYMALGNWNDYYNEHLGEVAEDMQNYLEKWGVK